MWFVLLSLAVFPLLSQQYTGEINEICKDPIDMGDQKCDKTASIRYYLDVETSECLAFKYTGCGGNRNNFQSKLQCLNKCIKSRPKVGLPSVGVVEMGKKKPAKDECDDKNKCPNGLTCMDLRAAKHCVNDEDRKRLSDLLGDCGKKMPVETEDDGNKIILRGKLCKHNFCPEGSECHQGYFTAYCCK